MAFNSREYEWADVSVIAGGRDLLRIRGVKWERKKELEPVYAKGDEPVAIQGGNKSYTITLTMLQSEYDALEAAANDDIFSLRIDIEVSFGNPTKGDAMKTHRALGVRFSEDTFEIKQGDKFGEVSLPGLCLSIQKNV